MGNKKVPGECCTLIGCTAEEATYVTHMGLNRLGTISNINTKWKNIALQMFKGFSFVNTDVAAKFSGGLQCQCTNHIMEVDHTKSTLPLDGVGDKV